jgi:hypothetical protein
MNAPARIIQQMYWLSIEIPMHVALLQLRTWARHDQARINKP